MVEETFSTLEVIKAIDDFLNYGEQSFVEQPHVGDPTQKGHRGYFSGGGWAARVLRYHKAQLEKLGRTQRLQEAAPELLAILKNVLEASNNPESDCSRYGRLFATLYRDVQQRGAALIHQIEKGA